ncbi:MAG TPA: hypothetical protein VFY05_00415 [Candidatus Angelobacter sp.]|nr:hypothetical protein [Candidatus Angelobacter sp.]
MIHRARDLSLDEKNALERLIGRSISDEEAVSIRVLQLPGGISAQRREEILMSLKTLFAAVDSRRSPASDEEADEIINTALKSTRPEFRSHH